MTNEEYWLWLCGTEGIYHESISRLLSVYETPEEIFKAGPEKIAEAKIIRRELVNNLENEKKSEAFLRRREKMEAAGISFIYYESENFPPKLKNIPAHPYCLYVRGRLPDPNLPSCAVVGARACSEYGKKQAVRFASALAGNGIQIISGMASGIDSIAQKAAIESGGMTFAVLGGGADVIYPVQNTQLYYSIIAEGGGIISEYPPGTAPLAWQFPSRNRIISGLSDKLLIIEARKRSGSLSTARHALDQGRDIYALPGRLTDPLSEGCNALIYDGAGILMDPCYIINDIFWDTSPLAGKRYVCPGKDEADETGLIKYLSYHAQPVGEIAQKAGLGVEETVIELAGLELEGRVKEVGKDFYVKI